MTSLPLAYIILLYACCLVTSMRLRQREREELIQQHNTIRRQFALGSNGIKIANMNALTWSSSLENTVRRIIELEQTIPEGVNIPQPFLLRLNVASLTTRNVTSAIQIWYSERVHLMVDYDVCLYLRDCIRFITMMNAEHRHVGCAYKVTSLGHRRGHGYQLVCLYEGGKSGLPAYKRGGPCTKCIGEAGFCDNGLCVPCSHSDSSSCDCRKTCNKPFVGVGTLDRQTCTCSCRYGNGPNCDEQCENQAMYLDWDICADLPDSMCESDLSEDRALLAEFCPAKCNCRPYPGS